MTEEESVRVVDDHAGHGPNHWNPTRSWAVAAATIAALVGAGVLLGWAIGESSDSPGDTPQAAPVTVNKTASTIAFAQPSTTTTLPNTTTTTVWWGATAAAVDLQADIRLVCERASPASVDGLVATDEWVESLFINGEWMYYYLGSHLHDLKKQGFLQDIRRAGLADSLALVLDLIEDAHSSTDDLLHLWGDEGSEEWTNLVGLTERHCAAALATYSTMMAMSSE